MKKFNAQIIRKKWIDFFEQHDHYFLKPLSLIPENDQSLLFVNSGVAAIKKYFIGSSKLPKNRIVNCQKVVRTNDIENIGITSRHHSFFEMLGNFSINEYFKKEAVEMALDFLLNHLDMDKSALYFTIHDQDSETHQIYLNLGISEDRLIKCGSDRNFWNMGSGPCGPCTEIYYDRGEAYDKRGIELLKKDIENDRYLEIWNIVFSEFINCDGEFNKSPNKNIDTGAGLERLATIKENKKNNFENSLFMPIIQVASSFSTMKYTYNEDVCEESGNKNQDKQDPKTSNNTESELIKINSFYQIIADHFRSTVMILNDGVSFGNKDRQYILRKLFRRAMSASWILKIDEDFIIPTINAVINTLSDFYTELEVNKSKIIQQVQEEYKNFKPILLKTNIYIDKLINSEIFDDLETKIFILVERHGVPHDLIEQRLFSKNIHFCKEKYAQIFEQHRKSSQNKKFKAAFENYDENQTNNNNKTGVINETEFLYDDSFIDNIKIINIYDENHNKQESLNNQSGYLVFEKTLFFPESAGQDRDFGWIEKTQTEDKKSTTDILDVQKNTKLEILHKVNQGIFAINDHISLFLNTQRRNGTSLHHTLEHLIYAFLQTEISSSLKRESAKKTETYCKLAFEKPGDVNSLDIIKNIETRGQEAIKNAIQVESWYSTTQECENLNLDYKKLINLGKAKDKFRIVKMGNLTTELCAGTHLKNTSEIEDLIVSDCIKKSGNIYEIKVIGGKSNIELFLGEQEQMDREKFDIIFEKINHIETELNEKFKLQKSTDLNCLLELSYPPELKYSKFLSAKDHCYLSAKTQINEKLYEFQQLHKQKALLKSQFKLNELKDHLHVSVKDNVSLINIQNYEQKELFQFLHNYTIPTNTKCLVIFNETNNMINFFILGEQEFSKRIFNYLKEKFNAFGGGKKIISGNLNLCNATAVKIIEAISEFIVDGFVDL